MENDVKALYEKERIKVKEMEERREQAAEENRLLTGYVAYDHQYFYEVFNRRLLAILDNSVQPYSIPFQTMQPAAPTVNWESMEKYGLDTSLIPAGADVFH